MKKIIIDTNSWILIAEERINILEELHKICDFPYKVFILKGTIAELNKIMEEQRGKFKRAAKLALSLIKALGIKILPSSGYVDDELVKYSKKKEVILTQDKELKERLTKPLLTIRQKKRVILVK